MAMVYDIPRMVNQTMLKVLMHADIYFHFDGRDEEDAVLDAKRRFRSKFYDRRADSLLVDEDTMFNEMLDIYDGDPRKVAMEEDADDAETFQRYQLSEIAKMIKRKDPNEAAQTVAGFGRAFVDLIELINRREPKRAIYTDWEAASRVLNHFTDHTNPCSLTPNQSEMLDSSHKVAMDISTVSAWGCKQGGKVHKVIFEDYIAPSQRCKEWSHYKAALKGLESVRMSSMTPTIRETHDAIRNFGRVVTVDALKVDNNTMYTNLGIDNEVANQGVYRWLNSFIFVFRSYICVLDLANLEQIQIVCKQWEGAYLYAQHYRRLGDTSRDDFLSPLRQVDKWMHNNFAACGFNDSFCRAMKMGLAILQNELHNYSEKIKTGWEKKDTELRIMQNETLRLRVQFQDFLKSLNVKDRVRLDLANAHYFNICPDGDPHALFSKVDQDMANPNEVDKEKFAEFVRYSLTLFLCKVVQKYGLQAEDSIVCEAGYDIKEKTWYKELLKKPKNWNMPPRQEWGMARISKFFAYTDSISGWYFEADDVSHVIADYQCYSSYAAKAKLTQQDTNELLYALKYAPALSYKWDPTQLINNIKTGDDTHDRLSDLSVKAEANKPSHKARDIHAADDITRVLTSSIDKLCIHASRLLPGVVSRKGEKESEAIFDYICKITRDDHEDDKLIISSDVSSWSPKAPREAWTEYNDILVEMTKAPPELRLSAVWRGIVNMLGKRGYLRSSTTSKGMYQGWSGTADSCFHNSLLGKLINDAKREKLLHPSTTAMTATLIDDAVQIIEFICNDTTSEHYEERYAKLTEICSTYVQRVKSGYLSVGAEIDLAKTIISDFKGIFLNQMVCEGSKIPTPMKVFAKCDRELGRRTATIFDHVDTILGSYRAAVEKGSEPIMTYCIAIEKCVELLMMTSNRGYITIAPGPRQASQVALINAAFAPRNFGGWGFPHVVGWLTKESSDPLVTYISLMVAAEEVLAHPAGNCNQGNIKVLRSIVGQTLDQPTVLPNLLSFIKDPTRVHIMGVIEPRSAVISKVRSELSNKAESEIFRTLLRRSDDTATKSAIDELLLNGVYSADVLALMATCMPEHCASGLVDRALMNEMSQVLFRFRVRTQIATTVKRRNRAAVIHLLDFGYHENYANTTMSRTEIYTKAKRVREDWYSTMGYTITNHTRQDYATSLTHHRIDQTSCISATVEQIISPCKNEGVDYANMYDGYIRRPKLTTPTSSKVYSFGKDFEKSFDPVRVCIHKAAVISTYLSANGYEGSEFWGFVRSSWGVTSDGVFPAVAYKADAFASVKRMSPLSSNPTHPIACYKGILGMATIDASKVGKFVTDTKYAGDYLSVITAARCCTLLDYSALLGKMDPKDYQANYGFIQGSLWEYDKDIWRVTNKEGYTFAIKTLNDIPKPDLAREFERVVVTSNLDPDLVEDDLLVKVAFNALSRPDINLVEENRLLFTLSSLGYNMPPANYRSKRSTMVAGDHKLAVSVRGLESRYATHKSRMGEHNAAIAILIEQVCTYLPNEPDLDFLLANWADIGSTFTDMYSRYIQKWDAIKRGTRTITQKINRTAFSKLFPNIGLTIGEDEYASFANFGALTNDSIAIIMGTLYSANHGRYQSDEGYQLAARHGVMNMKVSWNTTFRRFLSRPKNLSQKLLAHGFRGLSDHAEIAMTIQELYRAFADAIYMSLISANGLTGYGPPPQAFSLSMATLDTEVDEMAEWFREPVLEKHNVDITRNIKKGLREIFTDLKIVGMSRVTLGSVPEPVADLNPDAWGDIPLMDHDFAAEEMLVDAEPGVGGDPDEDMTYACKLFMTHGVAAAHLYLQTVQEGRIPNRNERTEQMVLEDEDLIDFSRELDAYRKEKAILDLGAQDIY